MPTLEPVVLEIDALPVLTFAAHQSGIAVVRQLRLTSTTDVALSEVEVRVWVEPSGTVADSLGPYTHAVGSLAPGAIVVLDDVAPNIDIQALSRLPERLRGALHYSVVASGTVIAQGSRTLDILAVNEWPGLSPLPHLLAAFVLPNDPAVGPILKGAADFLAAHELDPSLEGYQRQDRRRVLELVQAIYSAIQALDITYVSVPASFEAAGQKIRSPSAVVAEGLATCLDVAVLAAACLEQIGLNPLLVLVEGHAFTAVWLDENRLGQPWVQDAATLRNLVQVADIFAFDSTTLVARPQRTLAVAERAARAHLEDSVRVLGVVDVAAARADRVLPLPLPGGQSGTSGTRAQTAPATTATLPAEGTLAARDRAAARAPRISHPRLDAWLRQLLDLTMRNRLLAFAPDGRTVIPLIEAATDAHAGVESISGLVENRLALGERLEVAPSRLEGEDPRSKRSRETPEALLEHAAMVKDELAARRLVSPLTAADLERRMTELFRQARIDLEDGGANTLYVAIGQLHYVEAGAGTTRQAPILLWPCRIVRDSAKSAWRVERSDDDPILNQTLVEYLRRYFSLDLGGLSAAQEGDGGVDVDGLLTAVRTAIRGQTGWHVTAEVHLAAFKFAKFLLWRDLETHKDALLESPIVRSLVDGVPLVLAAGDANAWVPPEQLDSRAATAEVPIVLDADSSQMAIVVAALAGQSFAVQGPPGTGKSQTIANLVAAAIGQGKTVLVVAEKLAALSVVYERMKRAGLGDFCLELHSNKANKNEVLQSMARVLEQAGNAPASGFREGAAQIGITRDTLNHYVAALHDPRPLGASVFAVSSRLRRLHDVAPRPEQRFKSPRELTEGGWRRLETVTRELVDAARPLGDLAAHPLREVSLTHWSTSARAEVELQLRTVPRLVAAVQDAVVDAAQILGLPSMALSTAGSHRIAFVAATLVEAPPRACLEAGSWSRVEEPLRAYSARVQRVAATRAELATRYTDGLWGLDELGGLAARFRKWAPSWAWVRWIMLRGARRILRPIVNAGRTLGPALDVAGDLERVTAARQEKESLAAERLRLIGLGLPAVLVDAADEPAYDARLELLAAVPAAVHEVLKAHGEIAPPVPMLELLFGGGATPDQRDRVRNAARTLAAALEAVEACEDALMKLLVLRPASAWPARSEVGHLAAFEARSAEWLPVLDSLRAVTAHRAALETLRQGGLEALADAHQQGRLPADKLLETLSRTFQDAWLADTEDHDPRLTGFHGERHHRFVREFAAADHAQSVLGQKEVRSRLAARVPSPAGIDRGVDSELSLLLRESKKKTRHMALRRLFQEIPTLLPRLKPCLLMSPLSVAQYLPTSGRPFDLVVFDEASQIGPHDAVGTLARGRQVIVVGDSKQLPPTSFFSSDAGAVDSPAGVDEASATQDMESILDEVIASGLPQHGLEWHYRSRDERLIAFSNFHYYDNRLQTFPSPAWRSEGPKESGAQEPIGGVVWRPLEGVYDRGDTGTTRVEAEAVVQRLTELLAEPDGPSVGVVTFSMAQQKLVEDLFEAARRDDPELDSRVAAAEERPFIKNLENVQGDERDIMLFSVGYGPDDRGRVLMNFGPLNKAGGERRLNVAITRARVRLEVFSILRPDQIDLGRTNAVGVRHLKDFLRYAQLGPRSLGRPDAAGEAADAPFEAEVGRALEAMGATVHARVGWGKYRIDLGVAHPDKPGSYLLGVECDGDAYRSARTARDRDRLREQVLTGLGWRLHRVWSTDWRHDRATELERLRVAYEAAKAAEGPPVVPDPPKRTSSRLTIPRLQSVHEAEPEPLVTPYTEAPLPRFRGRDREALFDAGSVRAVADQVRSVVKVEGPVHAPALARRIAASWGFDRLSGRVSDQIDRGIEHSVKNGAAQLSEGFLWRTDQKQAEFDAPRGPSPAGFLRSGEEIAIEEIAALVRRVLARHLSIDRRDLTRITAQALGYASVGRRIGTRIEDALVWMEEHGQARPEGERLALVDG